MLRSNDPLPGDSRSGLRYRDKFQTKPMTKTLQLPALDDRHTKSIAVLNAKNEMLIDHNYINELAENSIDIQEPPMDRSDSSFFHKLSQRTL